MNERKLPAGYYTTIINSPSFDVSTKKDRAIFYSGVDNSVKRMVDGADGKSYKLAGIVSGSAGFMHLEGTPGGKWLMEQDLSHLPKEDVVKVWEAASTKYAREASGNVTAYVEGAREDGVFRRKELRELLLNPKVTSINGRDIEALRYGASIDRTPLGTKEAFDMLLNDSKYEAAREKVSEVMNQPRFKAGNYAGEKLTQKLPQRIEDRGKFVIRRGMGT
jgi:hypothetical protein